MIFDITLFSPTWSMTADIVRRNVGRFVLIAALASLAGMAFDYVVIIRPTMFPVMNILYLIVSLMIQVVVIVYVLTNDGGVVVCRRWPFVPLFILGLLTSIATLLGALLLVLPAIYLTGRWFIAAPVMIAENISASEAMTRSWDLLEKRWLAGSLLACMFFVWRFAPLMVEMFIPDASSETLWIARFMGNIVSESGNIVSIVANVSMYILVAKPADRVSEIFG